MDEDNRPDPDTLLAAAQRENRGRMKIFLGSAPGVGKTYAMLEAARQHLREGLDVVAGVVETHGRAETQRLLEGIEVLPSLTMEYRGHTFVEMDLDALLARRPKLALVDELAHTNIPGSRHLKRWQDVDELLAAGIDVYTTLNIQHLESLNDVVEQITSVKVRETLPDHVLARADEIELIDLPPHELIKRLHEGKVYVVEQAGRAVTNFFTPGNLTALRELALRHAAERVDAQMVDYMRAHAIAGPWPTRERLIVYLENSRDAERLVRAAMRAAERRNADWIAVTVDTPTGKQISDLDFDRMAQALRLATQLGGDTAQLLGEDPVREVLEFAQDRNATQIVIGRGRERAWAPSTFQRFVDQAKDYTIVVIGKGDQAPVSPPKRPAAPGGMTRAEAVGYVLSAAAAAAATGLGLLAERWLPSPNVITLYMTAVLVVASRLGLKPAILTSFASFLALNFFFIEPRGSFSVADSGQVVTLLLFLAASLIVSNMAGRLRQQIVMSRKNARRTANLYDFERRVTSAATQDDVHWAVVHHVATTINGKSILLTPERDGLAVVAGYPPEDQIDDKSQAAAEWAWKHDKVAGRGSATLPAALWLFLPLKTAHRSVGVLGVQMAEDADLPSIEQMQLLEALADQAAIAIERSDLMADIEAAKVVTERERLRSALLSSLSHDLRTPLVSIMGSASSLLSYDAMLDETKRHDLAQTIQDEAERLNRFVQNLLDMTRLGAGSLKPRLDWADLHDIVASALSRAQKLARNHTLKVELPADLPLLHVDSVLLEQVFFNLLDNASKYSPPETTIKLWAMAARDHITVEVADQGPGIAEADREKVFDMFYRVRQGDNQVAGTGLGLAICRGIVEAHGGTIRAEPGMNGAGTCIVITLPRPDTPLPSTPDDPGTVGET